MHQKHKAECLLNLKKGHPNWRGDFILKKKEKKTPKLSLHLSVKYLHDFFVPIQKTFRLKNLTWRRTLNKRIDVAVSFRDMICLLEEKNGLQ